jgi:hypothetical protein
LTETLTSDSSRINAYLSLVFKVSDAYRLALSWTKINVGTTSYNYVPTMYNKLKYK